MRPCKSCSKLFQQYNTVQNLCFACTRQKYLKTPQKKRKAIPWKGKVTEKWIEYRKQWIEDHGGENGRWICALQISPFCEPNLTVENLTLDHTLSRGGNAKLRFVDSNIKPACSPCNGMKGSTKIEQ